MILNILNGTNKRWQGALKRTWVAFAEDLNGRGHFLLTDTFVLLPLGGGFEALPGQRTQVEVHEDVAQGLQVVPSGLLCRHREDKVRTAFRRSLSIHGISQDFVHLIKTSLTNAQMSVYGGVAGGAGQVLVLAVGDVLVCASVAVFLGQAEVDDVDQVALLAQPHQKVVWLHVSVDEVLGVDVLNAADLDTEVGEGLMSALTCKYGRAQIQDPESTVISIQSASLKFSSRSGEVK